MRVGFVGPSAIQYSSSHFSAFLPYSMIASSSFIQQTFLAIYSLRTKLKSPDKPANLN